MPDRVVLPTERDVVVVDFPSPWANVFHPGGPNHLGLGTVRDDAHATRLYAKVLTMPAGLLRDDTGAPLATLHRWVHSNIADLTGRDLGCRCPLDHPCHADVLLTLANPRPGEDYLRVEDISTRPPKERIP